MKNGHNICGRLLLFLSVILCFLAMLYVFDNKYYTNGPLPQNGVLRLSTQDLTNAPVFLIDDWRIWDGVAEEGTKGLRTWIGEFSNYQRFNDPQRSPYGSCTYQLQLEYDGEPMVADLFFPNLCHEYTLWWDGEQIAEGKARVCKGIYLTPGEHTITLMVFGDSGYYTGMYFPGAIGSDAQIMHIIEIQNIVYGISMLIPLVLAGFCFSLWIGSRDSIRKYFALFSICFAGSLSHYFLQLFRNPFMEYRFLISDISLYGMFYFAIKLMLEASAMENTKFQKLVLRITMAVPVVEVMLYFLAPLWHSAILLHGFIQNLYRLFLFVSLVWGGMVMRRKEGLKRFLLYCDAALGLGILVNLFASNLFEPICGLWQFEWCSLLLVLLFAVFMERHNHQLILDNQRYQGHLEELIEERTGQLTGLLEERRAFFSDMAHDLKAPLSSIKAFMYMIRSQNIGMDNELELYLEQVDLRLQEMSQRVGSLNELNAVDRLAEKPEDIKVHELFWELYHIHNPEAVASGVHLIVQPPAETAVFRGQKKKILLVFENLFYNALRFTPMNGSITIDAAIAEKRLYIHVRDTGYGIPANELSHIFERFYVGEQGQAMGGSGLGLYIVRMILKEHGGSITVDSQAGEGAVFTISLPLAERT